MGTAELVFALTLLATFGAAFLARRHSGRASDAGLAGRSLNRWLIGLSAGTTANSGFVVTAAVGLGYTYGVQWMMLPVSWLLGDLFYWRVFPSRINRYGHETKAATLSEMIAHGLEGPLATWLTRGSALIVTVCLGGYIAAQWLAGQKFLGGAFNLPDYVALILFALIIVGYSTIGGFRGSIYVDTFQSFVRVVGTVIALWAVIAHAHANVDAFNQSLSSAGPDFLNPFPAGLIAGVGFVAGFAAAAIGFGLGQPQIVSRYLAGSSPEETQEAMWIYIGFVQATWIAMTGFGVLLRGVMPNISDPEAGLSLFFRTNVGAIATGVIVADVFATIASTTNGLLISVSQTVTRDLLGDKADRPRIPFGLLVVIVGLVTMTLSASMHGSVAGAVFSSVFLMGGSLAAPVMIRVLGWRHSEGSLLAAIMVGLVATLTWKMLGYSSFTSEAGIGMLAGLLANWCVAPRTKLATQM
jgi:sodium/proline symporter